VSFLDYWTISHVAFWLVVGSTLAASKARRVRGLLVCLLVAVAWEVFEVGAERWWPHAWESPESLLNKFSDLLTVPLGLWVSFYGFDKWRTPPDAR
jgi:hypothetical protein